VSARAGASWRGARTALLTGALVTVTVSACGSRTGLLGAEGEDIVVDGAMTDVAIDRDGAINPFDAPGDGFVVTDASCTSTSQCDDHIACTLDACDPGLGVCTHVLNHAACDDGVFCDGDELCDIAKGCVTIMRDCSDGIECTHDTCDEASKSCAHMPDDMLCPVSHRCDPVDGCQARAFAIDDKTLYEVRLPSGTVNAIGPTNALDSVTDIALHPSNVLYAVSPSYIYKLDQATGASTRLAPLTGGDNVNGADVAPDGTLYIAGSTDLFRVDTKTNVATQVASFPMGTESSGDLAFIGNRLVASARQGTGNDILVELDPTGGTPKIIGSIGFACVWGLAAFGQTLYGLTCDGTVISIDPVTGAGTMLTQTMTGFYGASAR
jgi:hypothetical protein